MRSKAGEDPLSELEELDFAYWYERAWPRIVRAVVVFTSEPDTAPDIAAEACARALDRWETISDPTRWSISVALNLAKREWRRSGREAEAVRRLPVQPAVIDRRDIDLWQAVQQLAPRAREAVALRYGSDLTERDVAEVMGIAEGTVAATLSQARQRLREILSEEHSHE